MVLERILRQRIHPIALLCLYFVSIILIGAFLLHLPAASNDGKSIGRIDALFTSASAADVTGLVVKDTAEQFSFFGKLVILLLIQLGGLGYMTMATFFYVLLGRRASIRHYSYFCDATGKPTLENVFGFAKYVFMNVVLIEIIGAIILGLHWAKQFGMEGGMKKGIFHAVSAFNNAGFDTFGSFRNLMDYRGDMTVNIVITLLIILGGIGFVVLGEIYDRLAKKERLSLHAKVAIMTSIILIIAGTVFIGIAEWNNPKTMEGYSTTDKVMASYFQSVTARTAGFNTIPIGDMRKASLMLVILLMFIGASPGSTGGGIKTTTFAVLVANVIAAIRDKSDTEMSNRKIPHSVVNRAVAIFFISIAFIFIITTIVAAIEDVELIKAAFEVVSAFGTVGLSTGITPTLTAASKLIISFVMFVGRVGPLSLMVFFASKPASGKVTLPEEQVQVG